MLRIIPKINLAKKGVENKSAVVLSTIVLIDNKGQYYIEVDGKVYFVDVVINKRSRVYSTPFNNKHPLNTERDILLSEKKFAIIRKYWSLYKTNHKYKYNIHNGRAIITI